MKYRRLLILMVIILGIQVGVSFLLLDDTSNASLSTVEVNELTYEIQNNWDSIMVNNYQFSSYLDFTILSIDEEIIYTTNSKISQSINEAVSHRDTIIDIGRESKTLGKVLIDNPTINEWEKTKQNIIIVIMVSIVVEIIVFILYIRYLHKRVFKPFNKLKEFSVRVAGGDLDFPLEMDSQNIFGAFSESFDLMREELKKARMQEQMANQSKKELVAKLSHDIKTPVASIKAVSELMEVKSSNQESKQQLQTITHKADQINTLISDLFHATLEELQELNVESREHSSTMIEEIIQEADYQKLGNIKPIPGCIVSFDALRLQQVFDNVFSNSYKYANTPIEVTSYFEDNTLQIIIKDFGRGVLEEEIPLVFEKFYQGSNAEGKSGAGLGLFISRYLLLQMGGNIECHNEVDGFNIKISLPLAMNIKN
ncbi:MAG: ATP-binding protein [Coprobacillaceae bacterium]